MRVCRCIFARWIRDRVAKVLHVGSMRIRAASTIQSHCRLHVQICFITEIFNYSIDRNLQEWDPSRMIVR